MRRAFLLLAVVCLVGLSLTAWAQDTANLVGTVTDQTGAVIASAKVTVRNPDKAFVRNLTTGGAGEFSAPAIPIGTYEIVAEADGFKTKTLTGIVLQVGQIQRVDVKMEVGAVTEQVTVEANAPQVVTENATLSDVVTTRQVQSLNLNGRNWVGLALLVPGANPSDGLGVTSVGVYGNNSISFNGNREVYNNWEIDGGPNTDEGSSNTLNTYPVLETIAEFRVSTSNYGADSGRHSGALIELVTKSGTKDFHGAAWEFLRNDKLDAQDFFLNRQGAEKRPLKWNDWGYAIGGPAFIPKVYNTSKEKTFFFWSQGWRRQRQGTIVGGNDNVPTPLMRNGDFSQCDPASSNYDPIVAEGCVLPVVNGQTLTNVRSVADPRYFRNGQILLDAFVPLPNNGPRGYQAAASNPVDWRQEQIRIDHKINDRMQTFFRYTQDKWSTITPTTLWNTGDFDTVKTPFAGPGKSMVAHVTNTFRPNLVNEFIAGYTVDHIVLDDVAGPSSVSKNITRPADFVMNHLFAPNAGNPYLPTINVGGGTGFNFGEGAADRPWVNSNPIFTWKDNLAWTKGRHTLKMGFFLEKFRKNEQFSNGLTQGTVNFNSDNAVTTGNALADMFLGRIASYNEGSLAIDGVPVGGYPKGHDRMTDFEPYFQDDWKVNNRLTLNLGLRYYFFTRIRDVSAPSTIDSNFLPTLYNPANEAPLLPDGNLDTASGKHWYQNYGNGLVKCGAKDPESGFNVAVGCIERNTGKNFAPRFGFALDLTGKGKTVLRGGWGMYFEAGNTNEANAGRKGNPPVNFSSSGSNIIGYDQIVPGAYGPGGVNWFPYDQGWPSLYQFNVSLQHQFSQDDIAQVAYVGSQGRHLARQRQANLIPYKAGIQNVPALAGQNIDGCDAAGNCDVQYVMIHETADSRFFVPYQGYTNVSAMENASNSSYHSLQTSYRHSFKRGLTFQAAYTWSHTIDESTDLYGGSSSGIDEHTLSRWRASSTMDRRHVMIMNYVYDLPFFRKHSSAFVRQAFGGWQLSGITTFMTGRPIDFTCGVEGYQTGLGTGYRCNTVGKVGVSKSTYNDPTWGPTVRWFDPSAFAQPVESQLYANEQPGMFGYMGRNILAGPGRNNWDMVLSKNFRLGSEQRELQFRFETYNTFNHTQWNGIDAGCNGSPNTDGTPAFGRTCGGDEYNKSNGTVNSAWPARIMQFGLKLTF